MTYLMLIFAANFKLGHNNLIFYEECTIRVLRQYLPLTDG